jgi:hypothetical protein
MGQEDGPRAMASKGGKARRATVFANKIKRWRVIADYFQRSGKQAQRHPYEKGRLKELQAALAAAKITASISTIRADIRELTPPERVRMPAQ